MKARNIYHNLSPLDHRYYTANKELFDRLAAYLSEEAGIRYALRVEAALVKTHLSLRGEATDEIARNLDAVVEAIDPAEVYEEEERTQHNVRAMVNVLSRKLPKAVAPYVHLGATSVDVLDTAQALRLRDATRNVLEPLLLQMLDELIVLARDHAETPQVGRTHGQHAVPITFGFAMAEYVARIGKSLEAIHLLAKDLRGKLAGAVGAYNATSMLTADPEALEERFLGHLGISAPEYATQLVEPEYLLRLLLELNTCFGIIANLADDLRHLQRSEIGELREGFGESQVGSSTMPQKRNPWNSEHVKSLWKAFSPRIMSFYMDQISEHQRDLTNSASGRFVAEYLAGFAAAVNRTIKVLRSLSVDTEQMLRNLRRTQDLILAEPTYLLLAASGASNAHETVRGLTLRCEEHGTSLVQELAKEPSLFSAVSEQLKRTRNLDPEQFFAAPELYRGLAAERARGLADRYSQKVQALKKELEL
jgi:adenylosuccinate lyase